MTLSAFGDKSKPPSQAELAAVLQESLGPWNDLIGQVSSTFAPLTVEWGYAGKSTGWGLRLKQPKRTVLYMTPCRGHFLASFALGEKAVQAAHEADLPAALRKIIEAAPKYAEGRGVRIEVRTQAQVGAVIKLAAIKMSN